MSNYNYQQQQHSQSQPQQQQSHSQQHGFVKCITIREFWGDSNLNQLCFKLHTPIEVDFSRPPQNGWQWGRIHNLQGWCPEWSITPVGVGVPPLSSLSSSSSSSSSSSQPQYSLPPLRRVLVQPHSIIPPHQSQQSRERNSLRRSSDYVTPLPRIVEGNQENETTNDHDNDGELLFDQRTHDINSTTTVLADTSSSMEHHHHHNDKKDLFENVPDATITTTTTTTNSSNNKNNKWNSGMKKLFSQTKIGIVNSNNKNNESSLSSSYQNPYTPKQEILEYDWTDAPQIMNNNNNGRMAIVETDGHTTNYKNEATYQLSTKTNEIADQFKTTTSNFSQQLSNWKMSPFLLGMSTMNINNNNNNNDKKTGSNNVTHNEQKRQQQDEQQAQKNQSVKVETTNNQEPEQRSSATTTTTKKYKFGGSMPSSFTFPTLLPRSLSKEQPQLSTTYCDRNGNEQTLVEENRRQASHTRMNIYY